MAGLLQHFDTYHGLHGMDSFLSAARLLGPKPLCCVLQFSYLNRSKFASLDEFLDLLDPFLSAWPADVTVAVEVRNKSWMTAPLADCFWSHRAVWAKNTAPPR